MTATYSQYASWSPTMQQRYTKRYGSAPRPTNTQGVAGGGYGTDFATPQEVAAQGGTIYADPATASTAPANTGIVFDPLADPGYAALTGPYGTYDKNGNYTPGTLAQHAGNERDYQQGRGAQGYGINAQGAIDYTNPYSQAAILFHNYGNSLRGATNSYASQGQLNSGAYANARNAIDWNYGVNSDQLKRGAQDFYHAQDTNVQNVTDQSLAALAQALGPAFVAFLQKQGG